MSPRLRLVASQDGPLPVEDMGTFSFARVGGDLLVLRNDEPLTVPEALVEIMQLVTPFLMPNRIGGEPVLTRKVMPGEMGMGFDVPIELLTEHPPCKMLADTIRDVHTRRRLATPGDGG